jgi:hypothetical protein
MGGSCPRRKTGITDPPARPDKGAADAIIGVDWSPVGAGS